MRFRFCGDVDCPDWVLAEIGTLSRLTSVKMKLLCSQVLKDLLGSNIDYEKVYKLTSDAKFESGDVKATIAALSFILTSAAKYNVDAQSLSNELQQLGLPKEHTGALCKVYADNQLRLQEELQRQSLRLSRLDSVDWRVDYVLSSSLLQEINKPSVQLKLGIKKPESEAPEHVTFTLTDDMFRILLHDLKQAHSKMESLGSG